MKPSTESSETKLALIAQSLSTMNGSITEIKADLKEIKNSFLPINVYNDFKLDYEKKLIEIQVELDKCAKLADISDMKKTYNIVGSALILAVVGAFFKIVFVH